MQIHAEINHNDTIINTSEDFFKKYTSHFVCVWEGVGNWTKTAIYWPQQPLWTYPRVILPPLMLNWRPGGSAFCWLSLPHLVSSSSDLQHTDFLSTLSYIIVQSPTQSSTQSLEWHVWSSSSGNNCHAFQRSLSSGALVYECIMGFYLVPFYQPNPLTRFFLITGYWNVSLPVHHFGMACLAGL